MPRRRYTPEEIISKLREAEVQPPRQVRGARGRSVGQAARALAIRGQTYYRWRKEHGGLRTEQAQQLKALKQENGRLTGDGFGGDGSVPGSPLCTLVDHDLAERGEKHVLAVPATSCLSQQEGYMRAENRRPAR